MIESWIQRWFGKDPKKRRADLLTVLAAGILLLWMGNSVFSGEKELESSQTEAMMEAASFQKDWTAQTEQRLEEVFSHIAGAGRVEFRIYTYSDGETVVAKNERTQSRQEEREEEHNTVLLEGREGESPLVLEEKTPQVTGILIVAEGGEKPYVKEALIRGAEALLDVPAHKVAVFAMEQGKGE